MLDLTPLFNPSAFPFSYSTPAEPPSPDNPSSFNLTSSSSSAIVFFRGGTGSLGVSSDGFESFAPVCCEVGWDWAESASLKAYAVGDDDVRHARLVLWMPWTCVAPNVS
ncbi:hypothetical protein VM1G_00782 [Cytospora mali]|uniref:Uncharacterized protein n=1 Tax=Cytospora mali TaxID=578113 RepID=A0A194VMR9_CYTMA|nr:hypothetical protein VM1G_00782 [Valsa mali]